MRPVALIVLTALATARFAAAAPSEVRAAAASGARAVSSSGAPAPDTIVWRNLAGPRPLDPPEWSGPGGADHPRVQLGLKALPLTLPIALPPPPGAERASLPVGERWGRLAAVRLSRFSGPEALVRHVFQERVRADLERFTATDPARPGAVPGPGADPPTPSGDPELVRALLGANTELGVRVVGRTELGGEWSRFRPCLQSFVEACNPSLLPQLSPELSFAVQLGGIINDRLRVDVDFDQIDPFEAINTINIVYTGGEDDVVRRLEVGDVTFALPSSRFLTQGIPAGNFGFQGTGQLGPLDLRAVWAEQRGQVSRTVLRLGGGGLDRGFVQTDTLVLDDADYVKGQFFFLVDPSEILGYPHIDVLALDGSEASARVAPGPEPIQLYRYENRPVLRQQVEGLIQADAVAEKDGLRTVESGWFRYLQPGTDYFVHASGLWIALRTPLGRDEMLAVTYFTAAGEEVGDYNPERLFASARRPQLRLLKASSPHHQPGRPTWDMEMHQVYRVSASRDVERASVSVSISLGELSAGRTFKRAATGEDFTFLRLFGLDREAPMDEVDQSFVYEPGRDLFGDAFSATGFFLDQPAVQGTFLVFPTLRPFAEPPPLRSMGLSAEDAVQILGADANRRIYEDPDPFERDNGGRFRLTIPFRVQSQGVISSFSLGVLGVREGSERIFLGERLLIRAEDYDVDYDAGQVVLRNPETLFAANPDAPIRATWEQRQIFQAAPTAVFGLGAHARVGQRGELDVLGLFQNQRTLSVRPTLGLEPGAIGLGGMSGRITSDALWMDRLLGNLPGIRTGAQSAFVVDGEVVTSLPTPNTRGDVFIDDFDAPSDRPLSLLAYDWTLGSLPAFSDGAETILPAPLDETTYVASTWQHTWILESAAGDSIGVREGFLPRQEIDRQIRFAGSEVREPGMLFALGGPPQMDPRWASMTTALSPTGVDLTKSEFLEFYAVPGAGVVLVLDLGEVSEDAFFVDASGNTSGFKRNGVPWGRGILDHEADPTRGEIWGDAADERGVWGEDCLAERGRVYRPGDPRANCTRGNGRRDSEDLNGNGLLDTGEKHLRWVIRLDGSSPYLARTRAETGTGFQLYRIPLQGPQGVEVGGAFTDSDMRAVKHIRMTVVGQSQQRVTLARMRIVGSRWIRRNQDGVLTGMIGDTLAGFGRVEVTPVSRVTEGDTYQSPPGVLEQLADPSSAYGGQGIEFSEKSLAVRFEDIRPGDRAEVYFRFPQTPRSYLTYREARLWVVARSGDWGEDLPHYFFFKVGTDPENFYLYRTPLRPTASPGRVQPGDWLPEVVVDFNEWLELRRRAELALILNPQAPGAPPLTVWSADSTYAVVLGDRGRGPDLANVREMAFGVWNGGAVPIRGEFWVDELRLSSGVTDAGVAGHLNVAFNAGDVVETRLTVSSRGANFRQLTETPTYQTDRLVTLNSTLWLDRFAPASWGVALPLSLSLDRFTQDPAFLANSDVRADRLPNLRATGARQTRVSLGFSKRTPSANPVVGALLDGLSANVGWFDSRLGAVTSSVEAQGIDGRIEYARRLERREISLLPPFMTPLVRFLLPGFLERPLLEARLRWTPERFSVGTTYLSHESQVFRYDRIIEQGADSLLAPTLTPRHSMTVSGQLLLRPIEALTADLTLLSLRDLLSAEESGSHPFIRGLIQDERLQLAGVDWGWETQRILRTRVGFRPRFVRWLSHEVDVTTSFAAERNTSFLGQQVWGGDSTAVLLRDASANRGVRASVSLSPALLLPGPAASDASLLGGALSVLRPMTVSWQDGLTSRFNRVPVEPTLGYQFGLGGVDAFRFLDGGTAATLADRTAWRVGGGVAFPAGVALDMARSTVDATVLDVRSDRSVRDETWPELRLRVESVPIPGAQRIALDRVSLSGGYLENVRQVELGGRSQQRRTLLEREIPVDVTLWWLAGTRTAYLGTFRSGEGRDPTGGTQRALVAHRVSISSSIAPRLRALAALDRPIQLTVILSHVSERECRATIRRLECVPFVDQLNRSLGVTLGTVVHGLEVGLQSSFADRKSFVGQRTGSTQFQLGLFGQFLFEAGLLPGR